MRVSMPWRSRLLALVFLLPIGCESELLYRCAGGGESGSAASGYTTCSGPGCDDDPPCTCDDGSSCAVPTDCLPPPVPCESGEVDCGASCCAGDSVCWIDRCEAGEGSCQNSDDCGLGYACHFGEAALGTVTDPCDAPVGVCVPHAPLCQGQTTTGCLPACELDVALGGGGLVASWGSAASPDAHDSVVAPPVIIGVPDGCGVADGWRDPPAVAFVTAAEPGGDNHGRLVVGAFTDATIAGSWSDLPDPANDPAALLAATRDAAGGTIVACTVDDRLRAYATDGGERWLSEPLPACHAPAIAMLGGVPAVVTEGGVLSLDDGALVTLLDPPLAGPPLLADVDGGAGLEIVAPNAVLDASGALIAASGVSGSFVGVVDVDADGTSEIVTIASDVGQHHLHLWRVGPDGAELLRTDVDLHAGTVDPCAAGDPATEASGGPPVIADLDGDGAPEIAVATGRGVLIYDGALLADPAATDEDALELAVALPDCRGGRRGLSAFDFDGDGRLELVASSDAVIVVLRSDDGSIAWQSPHASEPSIGALPIVDLDRDGSAELVAFASSLGGGDMAGLRVFGDPGRWAGAPRIWTQHQQPLIDVTATGTPAVASPHGLRAVTAQLVAANLSVDHVGGCSSPVEAYLRNVGALPVPGGTARVRFTKGEETIGEVVVGVTLEAGAGVWVRKYVATPPQGSLTATIEAVPGAVVHECATYDNSRTSLCSP